MKKLFPLILASLLALVVNASAQSQPSTVYLLDGTAIEGSYERQDDDNVYWKLASGVGTTVIPRRNIDRIEFPQPELWLQVMQAFEDGEFEKAAGVFSKIAKQKTAATYYPAPGNYATLSDRRLLDCYRGLRNWSELRYIVRNMEWDKLPREEREVEPLMQCWAAIGGSDWDEALKLADEAQKKSSGWASELGLVRALAYKGKGDQNGAVVALAEIYGPYPGMDRTLAQEALQEAATILQNDPERKPELIAMVHLYAGLFGQGKLWDGASSFHQDLLKQEIEVDAPTMNKGQKLKPEFAEEVKVARYVRLEMAGKKPLGLAEVQVFTDDGNVATAGKASQDDTLNNNGAAKAIDGNTAGGVGARSYAENKGGFWELDLGDPIKINTITIWARAGKERVQLDGFDLLLLDGARQEVYSKRDIPVEEQSVTFEINAKQL